MRARLEAQAAHGQRPNQGGDRPAQRTSSAAQLASPTGKTRVRWRFCKNDPAFTSFQLEIHRHYLNESRILHLEPYTKFLLGFIPFSSSSKAEGRRGAPTGGGNGVMGQHGTQCTCECGGRAADGGRAP